MLWGRSPSLSCFSQPAAFFLHFIFSQLSITTRSRLQLLKRWPQKEACWKVSHRSHYRSWAHSLLFQLLEFWQPDRSHTNWGPIGTKGHIATTHAAGEGKIKSSIFIRFPKFLYCAYLQNSPKQPLWSSNSFCSRHFWTKKEHATSSSQGNNMVGRWEAEQVRELPVRPVWWLIIRWPWGNHNCTESPYCYFEDFKKHFEKNVFIIVQS